MGTKKEFAHSVAGVIALARPGMMLDAFAGMGAVAGAVSSARQVWTNDVQKFAHLVGQCMFTSDIQEADILSIGVILAPRFDEHVARLDEHWGEAIRLSDAAYGSNEFADFERIMGTADTKPTETTDYSCFLQTYRDGYFTARQTAEVDALRFAMDRAAEDGEISSWQRSWALMALGRACLRVANTPGHFAQYLRPSAQNFTRVRKQGVKRIWIEWLRALVELKPVGTRAWRRGNQATQSDSLELLGDPHRLDNVGVVYCDPPYTDDQYSRYYHVWETLIDYDYPETTGAGLYRPGRFVAPFSIKSKVAEAIDELVAAVAAAGADLVVSYPSNGLLYDRGVDIRDILKNHYRSVDVVVSHEHRHSTFGASKGPSKADVTEQVFLATRS